MNNKKLVTVILLVAAVLVWGLVTFKVVRGSRKTEIPSVSFSPREPLDLEGKDSLVLDYLDPFLREFSRAKKPGAVPSSPASRPVKKTEQSPEPDFTYKGMIGNGTGRMACVIKNGTLFVIEPGEKIGVYRIVAVTPQALLLDYGMGQMSMEVER